MSEIKHDVYDDGNTRIVNLSYPRCSEIKNVMVDLCDVRAADGILVSYDFDRDGWVIKQASTFEWGEDDETDCDPDWQEVAFVQAWGREKRNQLGGEG